MRNWLRQLKLLEGAAPETIDKLLQAGSFMEVPKGTLLIRARETAAAIFIQITGKSVVYNLTHSGKRKILFVFGQGALLNEHVLNNYDSSVYCEVFEKSTVFSIPTSEFVQLMSADFTLTKNVLEAQEKKMWRLSHQLKNTMSNIYLEKKLASKLWKLARDFGIPTEEGIEIDMNLTITFLADMLGVPRETTSRTCSVLIEHGLIKVNKKRITIPDRDKMSQFYKNGKM